MATDERLPESLELNNDPPPSYNSVISDQPEAGSASSQALRRRIIPRASLEDSNQDKEKKPADEVELDSDNSNERSHQNPTAPPFAEDKPERGLSGCIPQGQQQHQSMPTRSGQDLESDGPRTGLWHRFKQGLEDIAMLVIQILD